MCWFKKEYVLTLAFWSLLTLLIPGLFRQFRKVVVIKPIYNLRKAKNITPSKDYNFFSFMVFLRYLKKKNFLFVVINDLIQILLLTRKNLLRWYILGVTQLLGISPWDMMKY